MAVLDYGLYDAGFSGFVDDAYYEGSSLLWRLGKLRFDEDPSLFHPANINRIGGRMLREWFSVSRPVVKEISSSNMRAYLLRDAADKLVRDYEGSVKVLIERSRGLLFDDGDGFIERLLKFKAYADPISRKAFLLAKFLSRRGYISFKDDDHLQVPVGGSLVRVALRLGLVLLDDSSMSNYLNDHRLTWSEDYALRMRVREALKFVSSLSRKDPFLIHDFFEIFSKSCCNVSSPICLGSNDTSSLSSPHRSDICDSGCPLVPLCRFRGDPIVRRILNPSMKENIYY